MQNNQSLTPKRTHRAVAAQFRLRIKCADEIAIGPGKIAILEAIEQTGSISAAGRSLGMSYRRAWLLVDQMNRYFQEPVVEMAIGGTQGGGTALTQSGREVVDLYRTIERQAQRATEPLLDALSRKLRP